MMHPKASRRNECSQNIVLNHCVEIYRYKSFVPDSFLSVTIPTLTTTYFLRRPDPCMQCCPSTSSERNLPCCWCTRARAQSQGATRWPSTSIGRSYGPSRRQSARRLCAWGVGGAQRLSRSYSPILSEDGLHVEQVPVWGLGRLSCDGGREP